MTEYTNVEMERMIEALVPYLERTDILGYAAARNTRILRNEIQEYVERKEDLVRKHGTEEVDENGQPTGRITLPFASDAFKEFAAEIEQWASVKHAPELFCIPFEEVKGELKGSEILSIDFMLED